MSTDGNEHGGSGRGSAADDFEAELLGDLAGEAELGPEAGAESDTSSTGHAPPGPDGGDGAEGGRPGLAEAEAEVMAADERERVSVDSVPLATAWLRAEAGAEDGSLSHLYRHHGRLVRVAGGGAGIEAVGADEVAAEVNYRYTCLKMRKEELVPAMFPREAASQAVSAAYLLPNARDIRGVVETPVFRPDGSLLEEEGYDSATGLLLRPRVGQSTALSVPGVDEISERMVAEAVELLAYPIARFPFVTDADRANWLGAVLTPLLAQVVPGPFKLVLITANQQGSGKTYLAEILRALYGGPFHAEFPRNSEEFSKLVTSDLTQTTGLVPVFDNVKGTLGGGPLAALLTSDTWAARVLGRTMTVEADNNRLWVATGNNVSVDDDMARRVLNVRIATETEHPEDRVFDLNPVGWVRANRAAYLSAAATLVRWWLVRGGSPVGVDESGDIYHRWRSAVAGILAEAEVPGGFDGADTRVSQGTGKDEWGTLLLALHERYGGVLWTSKEAANAIAAGYIDADSLPGQLAEKVNSPTLSRSLGRWLLNRDQSIANGLKVVNMGKNRTNKTVWQVQAAESGA